MDLVTITSQPASSEVRRRLAERGRPALLAFSRGKDSVAAWLALRDAGVEVIPYHLYLIPHLEFVDEDLARWEDFFGQHIINLPHPSLFRWLNKFTFQAPERLATIERAELPNPNYEHMVAAVRQVSGLAESWVCDGVRAADSPLRRLAFSTHGVVKPTRMKCSPVWDWRKSHVMEAIETSGASLGPEYEWFGRSFDGIDARFLGPLREHSPGDYERILEWFPLAELDLSEVRHG